MENKSTAEPNWKSGKFRDGMFVGAGIVLLIWFVVDML